MKFLRRLRLFLHRDEAAAELAEEMRLHVELRARKLRRQGVTDAPLAARRRFGNPAMLLDASAGEWGWNGIQRLGQDIRQAFRSLRRSPGFAVFAITTLAVGLGMNVAVFSVVDGVLLRPLPYPESGRLVSLWEESSKPKIAVLNDHGTMMGTRTPQRTTVSMANLLDYRQQTNTFEGLAAFDRKAANLTGIGDAERISGEIISANFFPVLGVEPAIGRGFLAEDARPDAAPVAILTHEFWVNRLGRDPAVLERSITLDGRKYRVVGVLPGSFRSPLQLAIPEDAAEFFVPSAAPTAAARGDHEWNVIGRLRPGVSQGAAQAELDGIGARLAKAFPDSNDGIRAVIAPLAGDIALDLRKPLLILLGASGLIVLITCVNLANLLLVRAIGRRHETSVRFALGAGRWRVARQFLAESLLLAAGGCAAGLLLGRAALRALLVAAPSNLPRSQEIAMDWRIFAAAAALATLTGLAFGLAPAWHAANGRASDALKTAARNTGGRPQAIGRNLLTAGEVALSLVLLTGAGLLLKSFVLVSGVELGFQPDRVLAMAINLPRTRYATPQARLRFFEALETRVAALPGVQSAAYANRMPLRGGWGGSVYPDVSPDSYVDVDRQAVSTGYFRTLGIPLVRGRLFAADDTSGHPLVAVIDQDCARAVFGSADPIGRRVRLGGNRPWMTVVGIVANIRRGGKEKQYTPQIYLPAAQTEVYPMVSLADLAVRTAGDPRQLVNAIRQAVAGLDRDQPITNVSTLDEVLDGQVAQRRFETGLLLIFAALAVGLAMLGVFGVLSYAVTQRTAELGIRIALGAQPHGIVLLVLRQAGALVALGIAAGLAGSYAVSRLLAGLLFHVKPNDAATYSAAAAGLALIALVAAAIPARRGAAIDPMAALRCE